MDNKARLLMVGSLSHNHQEFVEGMQKKGWRIDTAGSLSQAEARLSEAEYAAGILFLHDSHDDLKRIELLVIRSDMEWMALLHEPEPDDPVLCKTLGNLFMAFQPEPIDVDQVDCLMQHAAAMKRLRVEERAAKPQAAEFEMVGTVPAMQKVFDTIRRVASVDAPVFISGESGTGKELAARAIHERSMRAPAPFVAVNCGALPSNLIQSELFGHEKGAFTGASQMKIGQIEAAAGGTLFLDEIGDLPLELQVNLLRFLEEKTIQRIGAVDEIHVDVRVLSATHMDLEKAIEEGRFREDLYHRLNVLQVPIPPLRERQEDIEILAKFFFDKFIEEKSMKVRGFSQEALALMRQYSWPGNIRELINRVRRAMIMCEQRLIKPIDLGLERRTLNRNVVTLEEARNHAEKEALICALRRNKHKVKKAADELGVSRVTLYRLMEKHQLARNRDASISLSSA
ncbi:sigma-54-dependent Fis family transcriptional regulator [Halomonas sp. MCCC 1A17488]|uniref:Sigma-54-dependent Fis family transcriptional regulator n=1 Tax=Billgrantia sulfidoxydans TaxID=2733484 RepID=A0ABX7WAD4_9GAMM|nr:MULTISPECIES: sigma-54 dependent transcriptional regulator [Halomonas]MCE8017265.1 sigma-54-dependent Fis family transcriptional regulator [Halomonas sp. MCCC 1A17488]MCG3240598.1 sigma-54-dependent Fis family transcriptional regulator [Halomonas sp. MCCC 1A17488]QPP49550.1 sigma-54-dependent Fis family transcriptional regulator [Halomonas sp. SS10-MC5]QTP56906.1 sigma-54-dependent Fis family transcriptional regulator [Halomonas sulfidoxydans]